jgi:hypothetical protein
LKCFQKRHLLSFHIFTVVFFLFFFLILSQRL